MMMDKKKLKDYNKALIIMDNNQKKFIKNTIYYCKKSRKNLD